MLTIIFFVVAIAAIGLGDIVWLEATELIWHIRQKLPQLNWMKKHRPDKRHWKYY